ncbi:zinc-ribbon domain-containing protein [Blastopirellula sp. J2-11]|uniref:zinc-ribbon domain-containing protein n=1 Tax=Blastopirellula sp. J2-11 TaxID=2943192 RepID=UPI0021CA68AC|nr:zinc-ribbon domain-containing protein [Blastopirellula sp. J2-11]UUO06860.1 zinc-ribbon domain-containing protein [Blastopirellula sp. J2-11]
MKSNKQKRAQLEAKRARKAQRARYAAIFRGDSNCAALKGWRWSKKGDFVPCDASQLAHTGFYGSPPQFVLMGYQDQLIRCIGCGTEETWTAMQQKWWYEVMKGSIYSRAVRCRACRRQRRTIRAAANECRLAGIERKRQAKRLAPSSQRRKLKRS